MVRFEVCRAIIDRFWLVIAWMFEDELDVLLLVGEVVCMISALVSVFRLNEMNRRLEQNVLRGSANSHYWMHTRDAFEVIQQVLGELVWMRLVPSVVREKGKLNRKRLKVIRHCRGIMMWRWDDSSMVMTESLADDKGSAP